ncbi:MAG: hypothetical protein ISR72_13275 [Methylobacter sp.]|nr:hypothetical protein [Methylobacter sp.]
MPKKVQLSAARGLIFRIYPEISCLLHEYALLSLPLRSSRLFYTSPGHGCGFLAADFMPIAAALLSA